MHPLSAPGSRRLLDARRALCLLALLSFSAASCGDGDARPANDSDLPPPVDDSCARFGFHFDVGGCPAAACAEPLCSCPTAIRCISGRNERCMTAVDCALACATDPTTLFVCSIDIEPCQSDADCVAGRCVTEPSASNGECESGERGARCREDRDCLVGNCIAGSNGSRACSPGEPSDLCNGDRDCQSERCSIAVGALSGDCE